MNLENVSFSGKTGIITGAAQGIGKAIAKQFVDMGGKAVIVDINPETAAKTCEELGNAVFYIVDLGNPDEVVRVFQQIVDEQGKVEVLINNAGIVNTSDFDKLTLAEWNKILAVDLTAVSCPARCSSVTWRPSAAGGSLMWHPSPVKLAADIWEQRLMLRQRQA